MKKVMATFSAIAVVIIMAAGCSTAPTSSSARTELLDEARNTIAMFKQSDRSLDRFFSSSAGYAVYPNIAKGGFVVGGAHGRGALFENGRFTSYCDMTQATIGAQIGGQAYSEIIFFENQNALNEFKRGEMEFAAQATAVAATAGAATNMNYDNGVAVFVGDQVGLMAEASVGGQKFSVVSADSSEFANDSRRNQDHTVYGYANEQDAGWRSSSDYSRSYNAGQARTIEGEIVTIGEFSPARDAQKGRQITLRTNDNETHTVHLGPVSYLDRSDSLRLREGDRVTVTGSTTTFEGQHVIMAREIVTRDNQRMELRDSNGRARWDTNQDESRTNSSQSQDQQRRFEQDRNEPAPQR